MKASYRFWRNLVMPLSAACMLSASSAAELNPAAVIYKLPDQIPWGPVDARGGQNAVVVGGPGKPGFYMVYTKWTKGNHFSRPHFHPNDRYIVVLQGTWWVVRDLNSIPTTPPRCLRGVLSRISASRCIGTAPRTKTPFS
jgi:hypothetical protein